MRKAKLRFIKRFKNNKNKYNCEIMRRSITQEALQCSKKTLYETFLDLSLVNHLLNSQDDMPCTELKKIIDFQNVINDYETKFKKVFKEIKAKINLLK